MPNGIGPHGVCYAAPGAGLGEAGNLALEVAAARVDAPADQARQHAGPRWRVAGKRFFSGMTLALGGTALVALGAMGCRGKGPFRQDASERFGYWPELGDEASTTTQIHEPGPYLCGHDYAATQTKCFPDLGWCAPPSEILLRQHATDAAGVSMGLGGAVTLVGLGLMASAFRRVG